ncbi:hypothetical protein EOK75_01260 [Pseudorhodobacter turbinis]|uniref:Molybdopterin dinucleotide-binding domain-containing protein n=1 Tax=Pseudorhodobacter turbinis TaxID=2500533 RepID=A0A4P8ECV8_9RHOB|nr:molybdopterin dinucleotide binding domain-containing protein [Pseudorhodobacter turbinis]QCO54557.1 hypothetical protein EOK75_01260 [Pseudorhodobacter turbinis]
MNTQIKSLSVGIIGDGFMKPAFFEGALRKRLPNQALEFSQMERDWSMKVKSTKDDSSLPIGEFFGHEQVRLHPADAKSRSVADGQTVHLWNAQGVCLATAWVTDTVAQGVAILQTGTWLTPIGNSVLDTSEKPNVLILDIATSALVHGCSAHTCLVHIEPYSGEVLDPIQSYQAKLAEILPLEKGL